MLRELRHAILPPHHLTNIFRDWKTIVAQLAEPRRRRRRYAYCYVNAYGCCTTGVVGSQHRGAIPRPRGDVRRAGLGNCTVRECPRKRNTPVQLARRVVSAQPAFPVVSGKDVHRAVRPHRARFEVTTRHIAVKISYVSRFATRVEHSPVTVVFGSIGRHARWSRIRCVSAVRGGIYRRNRFQRCFRIDRFRPPSNVLDAAYHKRRRDCSSRRYSIYEE